MDAETAAATAGAVSVGGGLVTWFAKVMFGRLLKQFDKVVARVEDLTVAVAKVTENDKGQDARIGLLETKMARQEERVAHVDERAEGLSRNYGPRLWRLEHPGQIRKRKKAKRG